MRPAPPQELDEDELVSLFTDIALAQYEAGLTYDVVQYNVLFDQMMAVNAELKRRPGDRRRALLQLYDHPNVQVRQRMQRQRLR